MNKHYEQWVALRQRITAQERAFAQARDARRRGELKDVGELVVQWSEIRALRALSVSLARRAASERQRDAPSAGPA